MNTSAENPGKVLVVDDEPAIVEAVRYNLRRQGFQVVSAGDADDALAQFRAESPDLVILDIMLPSGSGFEVCRLMRQTSRVPILMLTARVAETDRVRGLEIGADDYLIKPFGMRELVARVKALLRRSGTAGDATTAVGHAPTHLTVSGLTIDTETREASLEGKPLVLSRKEFDLLALFVANPGRVFDRQTLLDRVWGEDAYVNDRTIDVHVRWLREKVEAVPASPVRLLTVRGVGYKFVAS